MAILEVVSVFDRAVGGYGRPFFVPSIGAAVRSFIDEVNRDAPDNPMHKHPDDYDLFHIGSFDDSIGELMPLKPVCVQFGKQSVVKV